MSYKTFGNLLVYDVRAEIEETGIFYIVSEFIGLSGTGIEGEPLQLNNTIPKLITIVQIMYVRMYVCMYCIYYCINDRRYETKHTAPILHVY